MSTGDTDRSRRALAIFDEIADLDGEARRRRLDALCDGDPRLRAQVLGLLEADAAQTDPLPAGVRAWQSVLADAGEGGLDGPGRMIGAWRVEGVLGRGGMGAVYAVERADGAYTQRAALKLIRAGADSRSARERFMRERQMLARLQHLNIATLFDGGFTADGEPYFVMERVDGLPIDQWCDERRLDLDGRVALFLQVLEAVQYAHRNLVVHRDLKPSNLLVTGAGQVKLLDFGIAKELQASEATATNDRALTFEYASPEQLHDAPITTATDTWQLGIVLHRLLSGAHPFGVGRDTPLAKQLQLLEREPEPLTKAAAQATPEVAGLRTHDPASLAKALRGDLSSIVQGCLRRAPEQRYPSVEALADDLRRWREHRPLKIAPPGRLAAAKLWLRRHRAGALAATAVAVAVLAGAGAALWQAREAREQARVAQRESDSARAMLGFLTDTFAAAAPEQAKSTEVSVRQLLDTARGQLDRKALEPGVRRATQRMLARLYDAIGESGIAAELYGAGIEGVEPRDRDEALSLADDLKAYSAALTAMEDSKRSLDAAKQAIALRERFAPGDPVQAFLSLSHVSYGHYTEYGVDACIAQVRRALAIAQAHPEIPGAAVLDAHSTLAGLLMVKGDDAGMLAAADEALAYLDRHAAQDSPDRIRFLRYRGEALADGGQVDAGIDVLRQAIALQQKTGGATTPPLVLYNALGKAYANLGRYNEAAEAFRHAASMQEGMVGASSASMVVGNLALVSAWSGSYADALRLFAEAISAMDAAGVQADDPQRRTNERNRAAALILAGEHARAKSDLTRLRARARELDGVDSNEYLQTTLRLAMLARRMHDPAAGQPLLDEAKQLLDRKGPDPGPLAVTALRTQAAFSRMRGEWPEAEQVQRDAVAKLEAGRNRFDLAVARVELAGILSDRGDMAGARTLMAQALPVVRDSVQPTEINRVEAEALAQRLGAR